MNEINSLRLLRHKNVIQLYEIYEDEKHIHLVFELMRGGELQTKVKLLKHLEENEAARIMKELLEIVEYCHNNKIIHRDIKPRNITFSNDKSSNLKLIDFGLSIANAGHITEGQIGGTPGYIAPEVLMNYSFNEKVDLYSCGVVLYFMLAGTNPFIGVTVKDIINSNKRNEIRFDNYPWISIEAQELILELTNINPYARLSATKALKSEWFTKVTLCKTKSIDASVNMLKFDSYGFCNALARSIAKVEEERTVAHSSDEEVKANKVPQLDTQHSILSFELKLKCNPTQLEQKSKKPVKKHSSGIYPKKNLVHEVVFMPVIVINSANDMTLSRPKTKSKFAVKGQMTPID